MAEMAGGREGRRVGARRRGLGPWLDRMLAERVSEIDGTYARLEGRAPMSVDEALEQLDGEAAERAVRRRSAWWDARQHIGAIRTLGRSWLRAVRCSLLVAAIVAGVCGLVIDVAPVGAEPVPFRMDASNQAGWWNPLDEWQGSVFVAYNAWGSSTDSGSSDTHTVYVARRDPAGTWSRGCLRAPSGACARWPDDVGHNQPTLTVDGDGHLHVFASMHNTTWRYFRTTRPGDPSSLVNRSVDMPDQAGKITYPNTARTPSGDVYLIVRNFPAGVLYRWDNGRNLWTRAAVFASDPSYVVYPNDIVAGADGALHIAWEWSYLAAGGLRHLGSYVRYEPGSGSFRDPRGAAVPVPATTQTANVVYQPLMPGESATDRSSPINPPGVQSAKLALGPSGPVVAYRVRTVNGGRFEVRLAEWNGAGWAIGTVYAGKYTTHAAVDVVVRGNVPRVYYAKAVVPSHNQAFYAQRRPDRTWAETLILAGVPVERLAVEPRAGVDHVYLASPSSRQLFLERR